MGVTFEIDHENRVIHLPPGWTAVCSDGVTIEPRTHDLSTNLEPEFSLVREWLETHRPRAIGTDTIYQAVFAAEYGAYDRATQMRIAAILKRFGYRAQGRSQGKKLYVIDDPQAATT
jgi:hypothetical protein